MYFGINNKCRDKKDRKVDKRVFGFRYNVLYIIIFSWCIDNVGEFWCYINLCVVFNVINI